MKAFQSLIERSLYYLLIIAVVVNVSTDVFLYASFIALNNQTSSIEHDQRSYIACLLAINPKGNIKAQEQACYVGGAK
jgi:hypothetical protein